jgi:energy-coupling factor transport system substrate-specific component
MAAASADAYFGARFSLYPMTGRFVPVILDALRALPEQGLEVETDDVSTFLGGHPDVVFGALEGAFTRAAASGEHVVMTVLLSRGCPGEEVCDPSAAGPAPEAPQTPPAGPPGPAVRVACQWSLYPLGVPGYMDVIYREIKRSKEAGVFTRGQHFVTRLDGELPAVLGAVRRSFDAAGDSAGHVVAHATLSANSPTARRAGGAGGPSGRGVEPAGRAGGTQ